MMQFDEKGWGTFHDPDRGDQVQFERLHPRESFFRAHYEDNDTKLRFQFDVTMSADGHVNVTLFCSEVYWSERRAWFSFRGPWEKSERLHGFLNAWAIRYLGARPNALGISDTRKSTCPLINEVADPPSAEMLQTLLDAYSPARGESGSRA